MESKETKKANIYQRMQLANKEIGYVAKNLQVSVGKFGYKAVSERDVLAAVNNAEEKVGLWSYQESLEIVDQFMQEGKSFVRMRAVVRIVNLDNPEEFVECAGYGDGIDSGDKAVGKAATYANKYALMKAYKIPTGDDPDQCPSDDNSARTKMITKEQVQRIRNAGKSYEKKALAAYKVDRLEDLPYNIGAGLCARLDAIASEQREAMEEIMKEQEAENANNIR